MKRYGAELEPQARQELYGYYFDEVRKLVEVLDKNLEAIRLE